MAVRRTPPRSSPEILRRTNTQDVDRSAELCAADLRFENPIWPAQHDLAGLKAFLADTWTGFPDLRYTLKRTLR